MNQAYTISPYITERLAAAYTKSFLVNPKDVIYTVMERALNDCPHIVRACNAYDDLVAALNLAYNCLEDCYTKSAIESDPKFINMRKIIARENAK